MGFLIAAPVGPIGLLCAQRALVSGTAAGLLSGLGAASADALYGALAAFGFGAAASMLTDHDIPFRIAAGAFLLWLGFRVMTSPVQEGEKTAPGPSTKAFRAWGSVFLLTLANPMTILSFSAVLLSLGAGIRGSATESLAVVAGVFAGSMAWWALLAFAVGALSKRISPRFLRAVNKTAGAGIVAFSVVMILQAL